MGSESFKSGRAAITATEKRKMNKKREKGMAAIAKPPFVMAKRIKKPKVRPTQRAVARNKKREIAAVMDVFFIKISVLPQVARLTPIL